LWLTIAGFGNLVFGFFEDTDGDYEIIDAINISLRIAVSVWLFFTAHQIRKFSYGGWVSMSALIWFLAFMLLVSPGWILITYPSRDAFGLIMVFVGQWSACGFMVWAWFGWWRNKKNDFIGRPE